MSESVGVSPALSAYDGRVPYKLSGNSVVRSDTGAVVKSHPNREKALAHLRALKANVEEAATGSALGALLEGFDSAAHPRGFHGRWIRTGDHHELRVFHGSSELGRVPADERTQMMIGASNVIGKSGRTISTKDLGSLVDRSLSEMGPEGPRRPANVAQARTAAANVHTGTPGIHPSGVTGAGGTFTAPIPQKAKVGEVYKAQRPDGQGGHWNVTSAGPVQVELTSQRSGRKQITEHRDVLSPVNFKRVSDAPGSRASVVTLLSGPNTPKTPPTIPAQSLEDVKRAQQLRAGAAHRAGDKVHVRTAGGEIENGIVQAPAETHDVITSKGSGRMTSVSVKWHGGDVTHERPQDLSAGHAGREATDRLAHVRGVSDAAAKAQAERAEILAKSPGAQAELDRHKSIAAGAGEPDRHGGFKVGDTVSYRTPSIVNGKVEGYGAPQSGKVSGLQRNGYLRVKEPKHGTTVDVHHTNAKADALNPETKPDEIHRQYARDRQKLAAEKASRAAALGKPPPPKMMEHPEIARTGRALQAIERSAGALRDRELGDAKAAYEDRKMRVPNKAIAFREYKQVEERIRAKYNAAVRSAQEAYREARSKHPRMVPVQESVLGALLEGR